MRIDETNHVATVGHAFGGLFSLDRPHGWEGGVEGLQSLIVLLPHFVAPRLVLGLLLLRQLLVLVAADLGHVGHGQVRVLLLDVLPPLAVVEHVH